MIGWTPSSAWRRDVFRPCIVAGEGCLPFTLPEARWIDTFRTPLVMDTSKAEGQLDWHPQHDAHDTLRRTVDAVREDLPQRLRPTARA